MSNISFKIIAIWIFVLLLKIPVYCQTEEENLKSGINMIYHLKFDSAEIKFDEIIKNDRNNPAGYFFKAMIDWWKINLDKENDSLDEKFLKDIEKSVEISDRKIDENERDDNALFYKGGALGYRGLVMSLRESWLKAAEDGREALNLLQKAHEINSKNKDVVFGVGLYNYFADYIPETYPVVKPLMLIFPKGDKLKGLTQIKETASDAKYARTEARFVLAYLYLIYEKNYAEAELYAKPLSDEYPENPVFEKYYCNSLIGQGKLGDALTGWRNVLEKIDSNKYGYSSMRLNREANYYTALCLLKLGRIQESEPYILNAEELTKIIDKENDDAYSAFIYLLMGMLNDSKGNKSSADFYYDKVLSMKNFQNSHQEAERFKKDGFRQ